MPLALPMAKQVRARNIESCAHSELPRTFPVDQTNLKLGAAMLRGTTTTNSVLRYERYVLALRCGSQAAAGCTIRPGLATTVEFATKRDSLEPVKPPRSTPER